MTRLVRVWPDPLPRWYSKPIRSRPKGSCLVSCSTQHRISKTCRTAGPRVLVGLVAFVFASSWLQAAPQTPPFGELLSESLDEPLEPLLPRHPRTEQDHDRLQAAALYATGRTLYQKDQSASALRYYQRALRSDPEAMPILAEIVPLAFQLGREEVAVRYALISIEKGKMEIELGRRLAAYLTERGRFQRAAGIHDRLLVAVAAEKPNLLKILIHLQAGRTYYILNEHEKAAKALSLLEKALAEPTEYGITSEQVNILQGKGGLTYHLLGEVYLAADQLDQAVWAYRKLFVTDPNDGLLGYNLARVEAKRGNAAKAIEHLEKYFEAKLTGEGKAPYELCAQLLEELDQKEKIIQELIRWREQDPNNLPLAVALAKRQVAAEQIDEAEAVLRAVADSTDKPSIELYRSQIKIYHRLGNAGSLLDVLRETVAGAGSLEPAREVIQPILENRERFSELLSIIRQRLENKDEQTAMQRAQEALAGAQLALWFKEYSTAEELFLLAMEREPSLAPRWTLSWGLELLIADKHSDAAKVFERGTHLKGPSETNPAFSYYLAGALEMAGKTDAAIEAAREAAKKMPESAEMAARLAWIQYHAKRYEQAQASYEQLLEKFGDKYDSSENRDALRSAQILLSNLHLTQGEEKKAVEMLERILDEFPEDVGTLNDLGYLWVDAGKHLERSFRMISKAVEGEPDNKAYLDSLGWAHYRLGRFTKAVDALERAAEGEDADPLVLDHLGDAYEKASQTTEATQAWQRSVEAYEKEDETEKADQVRQKIKRNARP